jgi:Protein O-mannosyl-transferase TMEM260-like
VTATGEARDVAREEEAEEFRVSRFTVHDYLLALLAGALALVLYLRTLAPGLLFGDSAEFQMAAWLGGFVHPTGYPLYLILGHIWAHLLPLGDAAWRMNLLSAVWGAIAVGLVYLLAHRLVALCLQPGEGSSAAVRLAALFAAFSFAVTPTFWSQAVIAEVYTLNTVFVAAVLLGLATWAAQPPGSPSMAPLYWTAAIYGLSLAHHRSMLLLLPAIAVYLWLTSRRRASSPDSRSRSDRRRIALRGLALVLLPLLIYLYIPLRAPQAPYATLRIGPGQDLQLYSPTLGGFIEYISGQVFGSSLGISTGLADRLSSAGRLFAAEMPTWWAGIGLALIGLIVLARRSRPLLALTGLAFLAVVVFNLLYAIGDIFVFYIPAYLVWVLWAALGVFALGVLLGRALAGRGPRARTAALLIPCLLALADAGGAGGGKAVPQGAILISNDRDEMVPLWYLQYVEGLRPDLTGLFPLIQQTEEWADVGQVIGTALRSNRPVFLIKPMPGLETRFALAPAGSLVRVTGPAVQGAPQTSAAVDFAGAVRLTGYDLSPLPLQAGDQAEVTLYWEPLQRLGTDYTTFVHLLDADGVVIGASDHRPGGVYYPTSLWRPGDVLRDTHAFTVTAGLGRPPYKIETGLYITAPSLEHLGQPERLEAPAGSLQ